MVELPIFPSINLPTQVLPKPPLYLVAPAAVLRVALRLLMQQQPLVNATTAISE